LQAKLATCLQQILSMGQKG